ncbi:uncharacterized protein [Montipora capricornis]|uniref:uncharacterized protein n=1 Tax=Montipora capricornis TaxID=246305 RepID=UPI0035F1310D
MGSPLAPVLANLFMGHHEKRWLENYNSGIEFYRRYVDDTFALFNTEQDALSFFSYINSQHPNIKFTMEKEENHKLPFLDVLLDNHRNQGIITSVFHKKTYTSDSSQSVARKDNCKFGQVCFLMRQKLDFEQAANNLERSLKILAV